MCQLGDVDTAIREMRLAEQSGTGGANDWHALRGGRLLLSPVFPAIPRGYARAVSGAMGLWAA
ncbi:hypothetical protein ACFPJ1_14005 [Kribbella qitaiheensis]|uniref:hypothetical protein n=1 Tax=Kribbella qitaiheensis TaxID=1544730 RepID=UPI0036228F09